MPSPFPGMDPYLEGSDWTSVHAELGVEIARQLTPRLMPRYVARPQKRFVMATAADADAVGVTTTSFYPDAAVVDGRARGSGDDSGSRDGGAAVVVAPLHIATVMREPIPHITVEIRDAEQQRLVTAIEVLSPTNKQGDGRPEYLEKRQKVLLSTAHLIEIDLLRRGQRVPMREALPKYPYFIILSRADRRPVCTVWPVALDQPLPTIPVPLLAGDTDVPLDLQAAFTAVYDGFGYSATIDYTRPPDPPLSDEESLSAARFLAAHRSGNLGG